MSSISNPTRNTSVAEFAMLAISIAVCFAVAATGAFFPPDEWYRNLVRPSFAPPNWLFGPVWSVLYLMIATSGWLVWKQSGFKAASRALCVFAVQLVLNGIWSGLFFGLHRPGLAFVEIVVLWLAIASTIWLFRMHSELAANLLLPYLAWVSFASVLNFAFWYLNR